MMNPCRNPDPRNRKYVFRRGIEAGICPRPTEVVAYQVNHSPVEERPVPNLITKELVNG